MANASIATFPGRSLIWARFRNAGSPTEGNNIGWGIAPTTVTGSANSNVNLFGPATEARTAGTSTMIQTSFLADTYQVTGSIVCAVGAKSITEAGLFDTTTLSPTTTVANSQTASSSIMTLGSATGFPASGNYYAQLLNETILVTAGQSTTLVTATRAQLGSVAAVAASGSVITLGGDGGAHVNAGLGGQTATVAAANGGNIFCHADFAAIALNVNDSINFTWTDQLT